MTSAITASVTELMNSGETSTPYCSVKNPWILHSHAAGVHGYDLVVKAREASLELEDEDGLERGISVAGNINLQRAVLGQDGFAALAVALISRLIGLGRPGRVAPGDG